MKYKVEEETDRTKERKEGHSKKKRSLLTTDNEKLSADTCSSH